MSAIHITLSAICKQLRTALLTRRLASVGQQVQLDGGCRFEYPENISLGDRVRIGRHALLRANSHGEAELSATHGGIYIGADTSVLEDCLLTANNGNITIGRRCWLAAGTYLYGNGNIHMGDDVLIAARTIINTVAHNYSHRDLPINAQGINTAPVIIGDDVWIGLNCTILQGVTIGRGAIVGAGSLVNKNVPAYSIVVGTPARVIGTRPLGQKVAA
jgi:acetyltransferase-like isoleucine patch superfamily enzyme